MNPVKSICTLLVWQLAVVLAPAQDFKNPVEYMNHIGQEHSKIAQEQWAYTRAVGHSKRAKKIEKRRNELLQTIDGARRTVTRMPPFNKSTAYRDSVAAYLRLSYLVLNEDYAKIIDMEEVAEQSYDLMEAYLLAKEKAREKQAAAADMVNDAQKRFAVENNINLVDGAESKIGQKMREAGTVFEYYNQVYLFFFKCYKQENYLLESLGTSDLNSMEQNRNALLNDALDSQEKLKQFLRFKADETLSTACREMLSFYITEARDRFPVLIEYFTARDKFEKIKAAFDHIKPANRTQENIDQYNHAVKDVNLALQKYNETNEKLNGTRSKLLDNWNKKSEAFLDRHIP